MFGCVYCGVVGVGDVVFVEGVECVDGCCCCCLLWMSGGGEEFFFDLFDMIGCVVCSFVCLF